MSHVPPSASVHAAEYMPDGQSGGTMRVKVSAQPHPNRHGESGTGCRVAVNGTSRTGTESTAAEVDVCRRIDATESPVPDMRKAIGSPGAADSGQQ